MRVYPSNDFNLECEKAKAVYIQKSKEKVRSMKEVINGKNILNYLKSRQNTRFNEEVYIEFLNAYRMEVDKLGCIEDFNITEYINENTDECIRTARKSTSPFLKVNRIFAQSHYLPRFVVGDDVNEITNLLTAFRNKNYNDFSDNPNGKKELSELKNMVVFYDEKGNYIPITDLSYINLMKDAYNNVPSGLADENITAERWKNNRSAYNTN